MNGIKKKKCVSQCKGLNQFDCSSNPTCKYVGNRFCRLAYTHKMDENCNPIHRRIEKRILIPSKQIAMSNISNGQRLQRTKKHTSNISSKLHVYRSISKDKDIANINNSDKDMANINNSDKDMANSIGRFKGSKSSISRSKSSISRSKSSISRSKTSISRLKTSKSSNSSLKRGLYMSLLCSNSGHCVSFGDTSFVFREFFNNYSDFKYVKSITQIIPIIPDQNIVKLALHYNKQGFNMRAMLKINEPNKTNPESFIYEYMVGLFLNNVIVYLPVFIETYNLFMYNSTYDKINIHNIKKSSFIKPVTDFNYANEHPNELALLMQDFSSNEPRYTNDLSLNEAIYDNNITIRDYIMYEYTNNKGDNKYLMCELPTILFHLYYSLKMIGTIFTHNNLTLDNVILYSPFFNTSYVEYIYHLHKNKTIKFKSFLIPKITNYSLCFMDNGNVLNGNNLNGNELNGNELNGNKLNGNKLNGHNVSKDLSLMYMIKELLGELNIREELNDVLDKVVYNGSTGFKKMYNYIVKGTVNEEIINDVAELKNSGYPMRINNIYDAYKVLTDYVSNESYISLNEKIYEDKIHIGDVHIYENKTPMEFIPKDIIK